MGLAVGTAKYLLFFFNLIFFITGIVIIVVGAMVSKETGIFGDKLEVAITSAPILLIVVGVFVALIAFFGCCGAIKHNYCMLITFALLLLLIFILELAAGITAYVYRDKVSDAVEKAFDELIKNNDDSFWEIQHDFKCCGVNGSDDWRNNNLTIPKTCCNETAVASADCDTKKEGDVYHRGCLKLIIDTFNDNIVKIGAVGVGIAFIQLVGIVFACCLASAVKDGA